MSSVRFSETVSYITRDQFTGDGADSLLAKYVLATAGSVGVPDAHTATYHIPDIGHECRMQFCASLDAY